MRQIRRYGFYFILLVLVLTCTFALLACSNDSDNNHEKGSDVLKIRIENLPERAVYSGDLIDLEDASIFATTRDGSVLSIPITQEMLSGFDTNKLGKQTVTITYEGCTTSFEVNVLKTEVQSISIASRPTIISVVQGGELDLTGVKLKVEFQSRFIIIDKISVKMTNYSNTLPVGTHTLIVQYPGSPTTTTLDIEVTAKKLLEIDIISKPKKLQYFIGDAFDARGLVVLRKYDNGTQDEVSYDENPHLFSFDVVTFTEEKARANVTVTVGGESETFNDCVVKKPIVVKFEIEKEPLTRSIVLDDVVLTEVGELDSLVEGGKIDWKLGFGKITYDNGVTEKVNSFEDPSVHIFYDAKNGVELTKEHQYSDVGSHVLYLRYGNSDFYAPIYITVRDKKPIDLLLGDSRVAGEKIEDRVFIDGSRFSTTFLKYNVLYDNATYEYDLDDVASWGNLLESMLSDDGSSFDLSISNLDVNDGKQHVNFKLGNVSAGYKITVIPKSATSITINAPYRNVYATGSVLDFTGSYLYVKYNNNSFERISPIPESSVTLYDSEGNSVNTMSYVGEYTAKVTYGGLESSFVVNAIDSSDMITSITLEERREIEDAYGNVVTDFINMPFDKTYEYANFESIPFNNIIMKVSTSAGISNVALSNAEIIIGDRYASGEQTILFRYNGYLFELNINIEGRRVSSIEISRAPEKSVYVLNSDTELDITGLLITKVFNDGDRGEQNYFDSLWSFTGYDLSVLGLQNVIVTYDLGDRVYTTSFEIEVADLGVVAIDFDETQNGVETFEILGENGEIETFRGIKVTYRDDINLTYVYNYFDDKGLPVTEICTLYFDVTYENGMVVQRELKASYISYDKNVNPEVSGDFKLSARITYGGQTTNMNLFVVFRQLEKIEVHTLPNVITYAEGQNLNREGGYVLRTYDDGTTDMLPMTNGLIGVNGYKANPFVNVQGGTYIDQVVTLSYGSKTTEFTVRTYRKLVATPMIGNSIFSYGDSSVPVVTIKESISGFTIPETYLEYLVEGSWVSERPIYPGTYPIRIMVLENEYYESDVIESATLNLIIRKKAIIIKIDALSKTYKENDPIFTYIIEEGELVGNDYVEIELTREEGEDVKYVGTGANRIIGSYPITAKLTEGGANNNNLYELAYEQVGLTINPKTATVNANGAVINVEFIKPSQFDSNTNTIKNTDMSAFSAKYTDARGFTIMIDAKDILYYDEAGNLLSALPTENGTYTIKISDNYSFQGVSTLTFKII